MAVDLKAPVEALTINLTKNTDFIRIIETVSPETYPAGCIVELRWYQASGSRISDPSNTWRAVMTSTTATWNVDKADVDTLIAQVPTKCKLFYIDGAVDLLWAMANEVTIDG